MNHKPKAIYLTNVFNPIATIPEGGTLDFRNIGNAESVRRFFRHAQIDLHVQPHPNIIQSIVKAYLMYHGEAPHPDVAMNTFRQMILDAIQSTDTRIAKVHDVEWRTFDPGESWVFFQLNIVEDSILAGRPPAIHWHWWEVTLCNPMQKGPEASAKDW